MSFANQHIQTAIKIINSYDGTIPLHHFLKQFFAADKKYGSKDRKAISHACYCYYRLGKAFEKRSVEERIKAGIFLCTDDIEKWKGAFDEEWVNNWSVDLHKRISFLQPETNAIFPFQSLLSDELDKEAFSISHLIQPDLFLRIRPGREEKVKKQLTDAGISFHHCDDKCIAVSNATKVDSILSLNKDVVVQDRSSQRVGALIEYINSQRSTVKVWDCCAASGGKSILAYDTLQNIDLTVSDVRPTIIQNLKKRFDEAAIKTYRSFVADLTNTQSSVSKAAFDLVICDAPCSGSGTWGRTPEQLVYFKEERIDHYVQLQQKITSAVVQAIKPGGHFLYITCSVFKKENEEIVSFIKSKYPLQLISMKYLQGYNDKADTMFAALFTASKP